MSVILENDFLRIQINEKGAELTNVANKLTNLEYMWSGDSKFWGKTSPILFPIVGSLKNNNFVYNGKSYALTRHGFARDMAFKIAEKNRESVTFRLLSDAHTLEKYPFEFRLDVGYKVTNDFLEVTYGVNNPGNEAMYFSLGAHPAFKVPLVSGCLYEDHYLWFEKKENAPRWPIDSNGLILNEPTPCLDNTEKLKLTRDLFDQDALVFKNLRSKKVSIRSDKHDNGLEFYFEGFPYLGIWAAKNADFVCVEPWCGIADSVSHDQNLVTKEGIIELYPAESWNRSWKVRFY
jgi:galactose mutarotase-like enzyme